MADQPFTGGIVANGVSLPEKVIDMGDGTFARRNIASPPKVLLTGSTNPRLRVDPGSTGFFEKREVRAYREFSQPLGTHIPTGQRSLLRFISTVNFILRFFTIVADNGQIRAVFYAGGTPTGSFTTVPIFATNSMTELPATYTPQIAAAIAGPGIAAAVAISGGAERDVIRLKIENSTGSATTSGTTSDSERGLPAGTYYVLIENIGAGNFEGVASVLWEER